MSEGQEDWTAPGAHEVSPGVWRIPLPLPNDGLRAVNVYAVADDDRVVMIDAGWALQESQQLLASSLDEVGYGLGDISQFLVTHAHRDHYTQAVAVRRKFGTRVGLGEHEQASVELIGPSSAASEPSHLRRLTAAGADGLARLLRTMPREKYDPNDWEAPDDWIADGTRFTLASRSLLAKHTPGHTRGHLVFHDSDAGLLFAGDHVLPHITPSIGFERVPTRSPLADYLSSLYLVREMPDAVLLPAHGPTSQSVHARVDELLAHHEERLDASLCALEAGADTAFEVAARLGWTRRRKALMDMDLFNQMLAILETVAHLDVLAERGHVLRAQVDGRVFYSPRAIGTVL